MQINVNKNIPKWAAYLFMALSVGCAIYAAYYPTTHNLLVSCLFFSFLSGMCCLFLKTELDVLDEMDYKMECMLDILCAIIEGAEDEEMNKENGDVDAD